MKLYTEEKVKQMIEKSRETGLTAEYLILTTTTIELPSDEEVEKEARLYCNIKESLVIDEEERYYKDFQKYDGFRRGAKWMRDKITNL